MSVDKYLAVSNFILIISSEYSEVAKELANSEK
jgi:hypothetical protein